MDIKQVVVALTGAIVMVILFSAMLVPIIIDAQHANDVTYTNSAPYSYGKLYEFTETDEDDTVIITVCKTGEHTITINGVTHNVATWQPVIMSDAMAIRYYTSNMSFTTPHLGPTTVTDATITISNGTASFTNVIRASDSVELSIDPEPITWAFVHDLSGDYAGMIIEQGVTVYAEKNGIYTANWLTTTSEFFSGKSGEDYITLNDHGTTTTVPLNWGGEYLNNGVYKLTISPTSDDFTFIVDNNGEDYTVHPFLICMPKTVVGTPDDVSTVNAMIGIIPIIVMIGIILAVVGAFVASRNDY